MKTITNIACPAFTLFALACFALSPNTRAVDPPPDGGYPGGNTAKGDDALDSNTTGSHSAPFSGWIVTGSLSVPRAGHTATLLPNGKVNHRM